MAISVDTVYKTVLLILNKEQRGYITPDEFNKVATQVQLEIFEKYFEDLNKQWRVPDNETEYADRIKNLEEKIAIFKRTSTPTTTIPPVPNTSPITISDKSIDFYKLGTVIYTGVNSIDKEVQRVQPNDLLYINMSPLTKPSANYPIYVLKNGEIITTPQLSNITFTYLKKPTNPRWGYLVDSTTGGYIYDDTAYGADLLNNGGTLNSILTNPTGIVPDQTYTNLTTTVSPAGGTGAELSAVVNAGTVTSVTVTTPGTDYNVGDVVTVLAAQFSGAPTSDLDITLTAADFNSNSTFGSIDLELHAVEQTELINRILVYSGVVIRDPQVVQIAAQKVLQETNQEYYVGQKVFYILAGDSLVTLVDNLVTSFNTELIDTVLNTINTNYVLETSSDSGVSWFEYGQVDSTNPAALPFGPGEKAYRVLSNTTNTVEFNQTINNVSGVTWLVRVRILPPALYDNYGSYEYISLNDIINNFIVGYVGKDKELI